MHASRRALLTGLAVLPITTAAAARDPSHDPIFAALARYRAALARLETIDERADPARYDAAEQELLGSIDVLFSTEPTTLSGCKALVDFLIEDADADGVDVKCLEALRRALVRLAAA